MIDSYKAPDKVPATRFSKKIVKFKNAIAEAESIFVEYEDATHHERKLVREDRYAIGLKAISIASPRRY